MNEELRAILLRDLVTLVYNAALADDRVHLSHLARKALIRKLEREQQYYPRR